MKLRIRAFASCAVLVVMFSILITSVFASTPITEHFVEQWRGNGSSSGRGNDDKTMAIGRNEDVVFKTDVNVDIDPYTDTHVLTVASALRQEKWYGYSTLASQMVYNGESFTNPDDTRITLERYTQSYTSTTETGDYYIVANSSGSSAAFYFYFEFTVRYTVG